MGWREHENGNKKDSEAIKQRGNPIHYITLLVQNHCSAVTCFVGFSTSPLSYFRISILSQQKSNPKDLVICVANENIYLLQVAKKYIRQDDNVFGMSVVVISCNHRKSEQRFSRGRPFPKVEVVWYSGSNLAQGRF